MNEEYSGQEGQEEQENDLFTKVVSIAEDERFNINFRRGLITGVFLVLKDSGERQGLINALCFLNTEMILLGQQEIRAVVEAVGIQEEELQVAKAAIEERVKEIKTH